MKRGGPIARRTPLRKRRSARKPSLYERVKGLLFGGVQGSEASVRGVEVYGPYHRWIATHPCIVASRTMTNGTRHQCLGAIAGHHVKTVGSGGKDYANEVPVCTSLHDSIHWSAAAFEQRYNINLRTEALRYAKLWDEREGKK